MTDVCPDAEGGPGPLPTGPLPTGPHLLDLAHRLLPAFDETTQEASKCAAELALALHYVCRTYPPHLIDPDRVAVAEAALTDRLRGDACLRLVANGFLLAQGLTPYVFLRPQAQTLPFYDGLVADFIETDRALRECTPYRRTERQFLLHVLGQGPLPDWDGAPVMSDIRAACSFNRDLGYAFTHQVFFCTDFGHVRRPDPMVKATAMLLAAQTHANSDVDLFWECCICLMTQDLTPAELDGLFCLLADFERRRPDLARALDIRTHYHPLLVHDILRGLVLRCHGTDITRLPQVAHSGPFAAIARFADALLGKDPAAMVDAWRACPPLHGFRVMLDDRLDYLAAMARHGVLFEREFGQLDRRDAGIYAEFQTELDRIRDALAA